MVTRIEQVDLQRSLSLTGTFIDYNGKAVSYRQGIVKTKRSTTVYFKYDISHTFVLWE